MIEAPLHTEYGTVEVVQPTQRLLEAFYKYLRDNDIKGEGITINEYAGGVVRAAVATGWFPGLVVADIDNMHPGKVFWLYKWFDELLGSFFHLDPNSFGRSSNVPETQSDGRPLNSV
jgi:hypothetical protein